jgi:hypothetical protein
MESPQATRPVRLDLSHEDHERLERCARRYGSRGRHVRRARLPDPIGDRPGLTSIVSRGRSGFSPWWRSLVEDSRLRTWSHADESAGSSMATVIGLGSGGACNGAAGSGSSSRQGWRG